MTTKTCRDCSQDLPLTMFYWNPKKPSPDSYCRPCRNTRVMAWRQTEQGRASSLQTCRNYNASEHGKTKRAAYSTSEAGKASRDRYLSSEQGQLKRSAFLAWYPKSEKRQAVLRRYYESGKGKATIRRYQQTDKGRESLLRGVHKRRAAIGVATLTAAEWAQIKATFNHACAYCGRTDRLLTRDHVIPLKAGGLHVKENIVPACRGCNSKKGARLSL